MKGDEVQRESRGSRGVTLEQATEAARVVRGNRPNGRFLTVTPGAAKALRRRFLGEIVHAPGKSRTKAGGVASRRAATKSGHVHVTKKK